MTTPCFEVSESLAAGILILAGSVDMPPETWAAFMDLAARVRKMERFVDEVVAEAHETALAAHAAENVVHVNFRETR